MTRPTLIYLSPVELNYYPYMISLEAVMLEAVMLLMNYL